MQSGKKKNDEEKKKKKLAVIHPKEDIRKFLHSLSPTKFFEFSHPNTETLKTHSTSRANPFPKVTDPFCRLPLPTLFYRPEAAHLGNLMRFVGTAESCTKIKWKKKKKGGKAPLFFLIPPFDMFFFAPLDFQGSWNALLMVWKSTPLFQVLYPISD